MIHTLVCSSGCQLKLKLCLLKSDLTWEWTSALAFPFTNKYPVELVRKYYTAVVNTTASNLKRFISVI